MKIVLLTRSLTCNPIPTHRKSHERNKLLKYTNAKQLFKLQSGDLNPRPPDKQSSNTMSSNNNQFS